MTAGATAAAGAGTGAATGPAEAPVGGATAGGREEEGREREEEVGPCSRASSAAEVATRTRWFGCHSLKTNPEVGSGAVCSSSPLTTIHVKEP